jgi:trk system potassium uptake protein
VPAQFQHPARLVPLAFLAAITVGAVLLTLPAARASGEPAPVLVALFTATSATCVTGLAVVDTPTYWSPLGQVIIMLLIQVGGFGIMTLATLLGLLVSRRLGLQTRLVAQAETRTLQLGDVRTVLVRVAATMAVAELITAAMLAVRFRIAYDDSLPTAAWHGLFHAVSAFNNAGFALYSTNFIEFVTDPWICLPATAAVIVGGIGFPVIFELVRRGRRPSAWTVHTRLTLLTAGVLLVVGTVAVLVLEWSNPKTLGPLDWGGKLLAAWFQGTMPRTAGFNSVDYAAVHGETLALTDVLMFIGGGSAGTAGGIKVTTFALLAFVIWAEVRGNADVRVFHRRVGTPVQRQALTVALLGVGAVAVGTFALLITTPHTLDRLLFEAISAFATVGLSTGITPNLPAVAQVVLIVLMFVGRVGTITVATALALKTRPQLYRLPEERPIVG